MLAILSTLLFQMTVLVALRLVTESRDQHYTPAPTPEPEPAPALDMSVHIHRLLETLPIQAVSLHPGPQNILTYLLANSNFYENLHLKTHFTPCLKTFLVILIQLINFKYKITTY